MRWNAKRLKEGDERIKQVFLFLPREINGEYRWLETVYIEQKYLYGDWHDWNWKN